MTHLTTANAPSRQRALLLSAEQLAKSLGVSVRTVWRLRSGGKLPPPIKLGGSIRWKADEVESWVAAGCPSMAEWQDMSSRP